MAAGRMRRGRWKWVGVGVGLLLGLWLALAAGNTIGRYFGWITERQDPAALSALLAPAYRVTHPPGAAPFPTALLFSGCDGPRDNLDRWAAMLAGEGWASVIVDSHRPRGYDNYEIWRLICAGQLLMGSERAGDVLVALADARRMPEVDPDRIVLIGASHGGWAIMEVLAFAQARRLPFNLASLPAGISADDPLAGVVGQILVYPFCGLPNRAFEAGWDHPEPTLFLLGRDDRIAPSDDCLAVAARLEADGLPVETRIFDGVTHGFDQQERSPISPLRFDEQATAAALAAGAQFLREHALR